MAKKKNKKRVLLAPKHGPDSFTRAELRKALKKVTEERRQREQQLVSHGSK
jgi:hypothetical protein